MKLSGLQISVFGKSVNVSKIIYSEFKKCDHDQLDTVIEYLLS